MNRITFKNVVPRVFSSLPELHSDIWRENITIDRGEICLVEASSGKGKSTFCSYISGYRHDYSGIINFDDTDIKTLRPNEWAEIRKKSVSLMFQELRLFPELTAFENVQIKNQLTNHTDESTIYSWFEQLNLKEKVNEPLGTMSFGQQQRVALMRALVQPFDILLADEPISHLDTANAQSMTELMMQEAKKQNACVIITSIGNHINLPYDKILKL